MKKYLLLPVLIVFFTLLVTSCGKGAASIYLKKGKEYYKKDNFQMAIKFFDKTLEIDSTSLEAKYYKALCYYGLGHNHHACEEMTNLMKAGYQPADTTLQSMGCFYFPEDTVSVKKK